MIAKKPEVGIGLIGSGFMGRCHANAFTAVAGLFDLPATPHLRRFGRRDGRIGAKGRTGAWLCACDIELAGSCS